MAKYEIVLPCVVRCAMDAWIEFNPGKLLFSFRVIKITREQKINDNVVLTDVQLGIGQSKFIVTVLTVTDTITEYEPITIYDQDKIENIPISNWMSGLLAKYGIAIEQLQYN